MAQGALERQTRATSQPLSPGLAAAALGADAQGGRVAIAALKGAGMESRGPKGGCCAAERLSFASPHLCACSSGGPVWADGAELGLMPPPGLSWDLQP